MDEELKEKCNEIANKQAFPCSYPRSNSGMTYREWLIGQCLGRYGLGSKGAIRFADEVIEHLTKEKIASNEEKQARVGTKS